MPELVGLVGLVGPAGLVGQAGPAGLAALPGPGGPCGPGGLAGVHVLIAGIVRAAVFEHHYFHPVFFSKKVYSKQCISNLSTQSIQSTWVVLMGDKIYLRGQK